MADVTEMFGRLLLLGLMAVGIVSVLGIVLYVGFHWWYGD